MTSTIISFTLLCLAAVAPAPEQLASPSAGDLASPRVVASNQASLAPATGPIQFAWPLDQSRPALHSETSTHYYERVTSQTLRQGMRLPVSQAGAVIKLSPASGAVDPHTLQLVDPRGRVHTIADRVEWIGSEASGAFRIDPALGVGEFTVKAKAPSGTVHVDVLERDSEVVLVATTDRSVVFLGDAVQVQAKLLSRGQATPIDRVYARLQQPSGAVREQPLQRQSDGSYSAKIPVAGPLGPAGQPWAIEVRAETQRAGQTIHRNLRTAVAVSVPTARLTGAASLQADDAAIVAELELQTASPGRYAVTGVLYGRNRDGVLQPIAVAQSADDLNPGHAKLRLEFPNDLVHAAGLRGPYELHDIRLVDQGRLFVLHHQARGLVTQ